MSLLASLSSSLAPWRELTHCIEGTVQCELLSMDPIQVVINYDSICLNMKKISDSLRRLCDHFGITFLEYRSPETRADLFNLIDAIASDVELHGDARQLGGKNAIQFVKHVHTRLSYGRTHGQDCRQVLSLLRDLRWRAPGQLLLYEEKFDALLKQCKAIPGPRIIEPLESLHDKITDYKKRCSGHTLVKIIVEEPTMLLQLQQYQQSLQKIYRECELKAPDPTIFRTDFDTISVLIREVTWIRELHVEAMKLRGGDAKAFMDCVQESLDRERQADVLKLLQDLSDKSDELPSRIILNGVEQYPAA
ncbi:hypothetical protein BS47DRAFT_14589 [Hydnum rufescens UP504]|uniref:Uncharacterized protein n=1 Tax=Hydnum rufescens UP504 TaxID=1448309 RepID=A0A9P6BB89_9AGAM|nr:hypothetical protein BS47DRAFT_14589 [Hydnum rufescens UP504]